MWPCRLQPAAQRNLRIRATLNCAPIDSNTSRQSLGSDPRRCGVKHCTCDWSSSEPEEDDNQIIFALHVRKWGPERLSVRKLCFPTSHIPSRERSQPWGVKVNLLPSFSPWEWATCREWSLVSSPIRPSLASTQEKPSYPTHARMGRWICKMQVSQPQALPSD